jgi:hypothetical protein
MENFRKMYIRRRTPRRQTPAAVPHDIKSLPPWGTATGASFRGQGGATLGPCRRAARRQVPNAVPHDVRSFFYFFIFKTLLTFRSFFYYFFIFKTLLTFLKTTN